jgi:hypothetical protein
MSENSQYSKLFDEIIVEGRALEDLKADLELASQHYRISDAADSNNHAAQCPTPPRSASASSDSPQLTLLAPTSVSAEPASSVTNIEEIVKLKEEHLKNVEMERLKLATAPLDSQQYANNNMEGGSVAVPNGARRRATIASNDVASASTKGTKMSLKPSGISHARKMSAEERKRAGAARGAAKENEKVVADSAGPTITASPPTTTMTNPKGLASPQVTPTTPSPEQADASDDDLMMAPANEASEHVHHDQFLNDIFDFSCLETGGPDNDGEAMDVSTPLVYEISSTATSATTATQSDPHARAEVLFSAAGAVTPSQLAGKSTETHAEDVARRRMNRPLSFSSYSSLLCTPSKADSSPPAVARSVSMTPSTPTPKVAVLPVRASKSQFVASPLVTPDASSVMGSNVAKDAAVMIAGVRGMEKEAENSAIEAIRPSGDEHAVEDRYEDSNSAFLMNVDTDVGVVTESAAAAPSVQLSAAAPHSNQQDGRASPARSEAQGINPRSSPTAMLPPSLSIKTTKPSFGRLPASTSTLPSNKRSAPLDDDRTGRHSHFSPQTPESMTANKRRRIEGSPSSANDSDQTQYSPISLTASSPLCRNSSASANNGGYAYSYMPDVTHLLVQTISKMTDHLSHMEDFLHQCEENRMKESERHATVVEAFLEEIRAGRAREERKVKGMEELKRVFRRGMEVLAEAV